MAGSVLLVTAILLLCACRCVLFLRNGGLLGPEGLVCSLSHKDLGQPGLLEHLLDWALCWHPTCGYLDLTWTPKHGVPGKPQCWRVSWGPQHGIEPFWWGTLDPVSPFLPPAFSKSPSTLQPGLGRAPRIRMAFFPPPPLSPGKSRVHFLGAE